MSGQNTKERPILFSAPMVRALLDGRKTQTRRVVKSIGKDEGFVICQRDEGTWWPHRSDDGERCWHTVKRGGHEYQDDTPHSCPYGVPGDRLWAREMHAFLDVDGPKRFLPDAPREWDVVVEYADGDEHEKTVSKKPKQTRERGDTGWRPSIHMPRWASRITLEVTGVRVERLQDISEEDAAAEGVESLDSNAHEDRTEHDPSLCNNCGGLRLYMDGSSGAARFDVDCRQCDTYVKRYRWLWESINGAESWAANPWVWVIEFKRARP